LKNNLKEVFMIKRICVAVALLFVFSHGMMAQPIAIGSKAEKAVATTIERLNKAMINADSATLDMLAATQLSYGHSVGFVENKQQFIRKIMSGSSDFVSIDLSNQTIAISGKTAIVRHTLDAVTNNDNKPGEIHLHVLQVWQKQSGGWRLLARQAVKQP